MKKSISLILTLILALSLLSACGKEETPAPAPEAPAAPAPSVEEVTEATEATTPETEPPTEPGPNVMEIVIESETYTLPLYAKDLTANGWEISGYNETFEEVNSTHVYFTRNDFGFEADITGTIGGSIYDSNVVVDTAFFYSGEGSAYAALADSIYPGMPYDSIVPTLEALAYQDIEIYETGSGYVVVAYQDDYGMEIHCSPEKANTMIITYY